MNLIINQRRFLFALRSVERIVGKNISLPILNTILLKTEGEKAKLIATNLEIGINYWVGAKVIKEGEIAIPARIFSDFIGNVSDEKLTLSANKNILTINSEGYRTQILGMDPKDFPIIPKAKNSFQIAFPADLIKKALTNVIDSVSLSESRPELSGVYMKVGSEKVDFAATDGFRLSEYIVTTANGEEKTLIIPRATAVEMIRLAESEEEEQLKLNISDNQIFMYGGNFELVSRLIDGRYPEYKKVIPEKYLALAKVKKSDLEKNIRLASIFSSSNSDIKIKTSKGVMEIIAQNSIKGAIDSTIPCELKNNPFELAVNYQFLLDGIKNLNEENVIFKFTGDGSPLVVQGEKNKEHTYVIMPLRV